MTVGEPAELKKPRQKAGEEAMDKEEWEMLKAERLEKYLQVVITGKIDAVISDMKKILEEAEEAGDERPVKIVIFSNFNDAFKRIEHQLVNEGLPWACVPSKSSRQTCQELNIAFNAGLFELALSVFLAVLYTGNLRW